MNNNIQEHYCSFEVSQKIWKLGGRLISNKCFTYSDTHPNGSGWYEDLKGSLSIPRPTHSLAIEWIQVNFGIWIIAIPQGLSTTWVFSLFNTKSEKGRIIFDSPSFDTPQEATEAGLLYTLKKSNTVSKYFVYQGYMSEEAQEFFEGNVIREERDGCATVGHFIKLTDGTTVLPSKYDVFIKDEKGISLEKMR